ncbi:hypothetical protein MARU1_003101 [Malassezia arunalokei]|uniref:Mediator of RNA polymerase II transcription subunit 13 n=1 Tax=Malassezia arunalokei TaxID=1514897 RepID=A0AAJ5Z320_9BASI|nr:hypothetical protein MARU1_003101 [Malassezia arunalokei]
MATTAALAHTSAPLPPHVGVQWYRYVAPDAPDVLADAARKLQGALITAAPASPSPATWIAEQMPAPLYALQGTPSCLWVFLWHNTHPAQAMKSYLSSLVLRSSGEYVVSRVDESDPASSTREAHLHFLQAVCHAVADGLCGASQLRVAGGLLHLGERDEGSTASSTEYTTFRAYTAHDTLHVMSRTELMPWTRVDARVVAGDALPRNVVLGETRVRLLPTLRRGRLLSTCIDTSASCRQLREALDDVLPVRENHFATLWLDEHDDERSLGAVLWPLDLCLLEHDASALDAPVPWTMRSAQALLASAAWPDERTKLVSPMPPRTVSLVSSSPHVDRSGLDDDDDDMFRTIGQLTEDDLRFFQTPPRPADPPSPAPATTAPATTPVAPKYDVHGKFFIPGGPRREEGRPSMSPRYSFGTPPSVGTWTASPTPSTDSDSAADEPDAAQRTLALARLHTSAAASPHVSMPAPPVSDTHTQRVRLAWVALYARTAQHAVPPTKLLAPLLSTTHPAEACSPPSLLVGCQQALIQVSINAVSSWTQLGLVPVGGPRTIGAHVVLVECDIPDDAVRSWIQTLSDEFGAHALGTLVPGHVWHMQRGSGLQAVRDVIQDRAVVYLVYGHDEAACERLFRSWPMPRADVSLVPVPESEVWLRPPSRALMWASYEDALHRVCHIAPRTYEACTYLCERASLRLAWPPLASYDPLHQGAVLHVAYDIVGRLVRVVCTDDRAQRLVCRTWDAGAACAYIPLLWQVVRAIVADTSAAWHVVIGRLGTMSQADMDMWASCLDTREPFLLSVGIVCLERDAWPTAHADASVVYASDMPLGLPSGAWPIRVPRSAYVSPGTYAVHLVQLYHLADLDAYIHDVVLHYFALQCMTQLRWTPPAPALPWPFAILACT